MVTIPAGQCHWCGNWKENSFGKCETCHRFEPMKKPDLNRVSPGKRIYFQSLILKTLFDVLRHVRFFVRDRLDFSNVDLNAIRVLVNDAYVMTFDPSHRNQEHPDLDLPELIAAILYQLGVCPQVTGFVDDVTIMYGYGKCNSIGDFQFTIPHRFLKPGTTLRTLPVVFCDLHSRQQILQLHAYKEVA